MKIYAVPFVVWCMFISAGCSKSEHHTTTTPLKPQVYASEPMSLHELCLLRVNQDFNQNICMAEHVHKIVSEDSKLDQANCHEGTESYRWAQDLKNSLDAGRIQINWSQARECLSESRKIRSQLPGVGLTLSEAWKNIQAGVCSNFVHASTAQGESCKFLWDCSSDSVCGTDTPFESTTLTCLKKGNVGEACSSTYHACRDDLMCADGICANKHSVGEACDLQLGWGDCVSQICDGNPAVCQPAQPSLSFKTLGEACASSEECDANACLACRALVQGGVTTCQPLALQEQYCNTWDDCALDLGCVNHVCTASGEGAPCGPVVQATCASPLACIPNTMCSQFTTQQDCEANSQNCMFDAQQQCSPIAGTCHALSDSGPCANGFACGENSVCLMSSHECVPFAKEGQACSIDSSDAPACDLGLGCVKGVCVPVCSSNAECKSGEFCQLETGTSNGEMQTGICQPIDPNHCATSDMCAPEQYCYIEPGPDCAAAATSDACAALAGCALKHEERCENNFECASLDGQEQACRAKAGCIFDAESQWCNNTIDCFASMTTQEQCQSETACRWNASDVCAPVESIVVYGVCKDRLPLGSVCDSENATACLSSTCLPDPQNVSVTKCALAPSSCTNDTSSILTTFLFGSFIWVKRRYKKHGVRK